MVGCGYLRNKFDPGHISHVVGDGCFLSPSLSLFIPSFLSMLQNIMRLEFVRLKNILTFHSKPHLSLSLILIHAHLSETRLHAGISSLLSDTHTHTHVQVFLT